MKVLVINQCSTNKGDRAMLFFVLRELVRNGVGQITVSASNPEYWEDRPDFPDTAVRVIPWGWDISRRSGVGILGKVIHMARKIILPRRIHFPLVRNALIAGRRPWYLGFFVNRAYLRAIKQADLILSTGGHRLTTINTRDAVGPQTFDMAIALLYCKPLILWSQSIGTFDFRDDRNKKMVQKILTDARQIFIRNEASAEEIRKMGVTRDDVVETGESVFGLYDIVKSRTRPSDRPAVMGISVYVKARKNRNNEREEYTCCLATFVNHAIEDGYKVRFLPMEMQGTDRPCIEDVINSVKKKENCEIVQGYPGTEDHINAIAQCKVFVGHKTHSQIFSLVAATPLLAIAYHKKTEDFMAQFGLEEYCIVDTQLSADKMIKVFNKINNNLDIISQKQEQTASRFSVQVKKDFTRMIEELRVS
jgi:polysaccharide pyruvyl transferase WcaK-like protein